jgi:uncharacterized membrane protein
MDKVILVIALLTLLSFSGCISGPPQESTGLASATASSNESVSIPLESLSEQAKWFEYDASVTTVGFFAVKTAEGDVKTAFDACDVCGYAKKGYRQEGTFMVCNNCGNRYPISGIGTQNKTPGGCWPGYIPSKIVGKNLIVEKSDLEAGAVRFK